MSEIDDLTKAAEALDHYGEDTHAENVREYVRQRLGRWSRWYLFLKTVLVYAFILGGTAIGFYGAYGYTTRGAYYSALGILFVTVLLYGFVALVNHSAKAFERVVEKRATELEIEGDGVFDA